MVVPRKDKDTWQFGDFQTPGPLADEVCARLQSLKIAPEAILEPTCGRGAFLAAARKAFQDVQKIVGRDISEAYVADAKKALKGASVEVQVGDFFRIDWSSLLNTNKGPWLILGNPPWVTNSDLGLIGSTNLPTKSNFQKHQGLDAITGKANFDISEWMLMQHVDWLQDSGGWVAMLVKTSVARKVLQQVWKQEAPVGRASLFKIDAQKHFGAAVDACLFVLPVGEQAHSRECDVYEALSDGQPSGRIGYHNGIVVSDVGAFTDHQKLLGVDARYRWRSGVKHDCSKVMELQIAPDGTYRNGLGEPVDIEPDLLYPMLKSSGVARSQRSFDRVMLVPQKAIGEETQGIADRAPKTWDYLCRHSARLDARRSVIYRRNPRFSVFGVGDYTFAPWKVAISGFYKNFRFVKFGPVNGKPVVFDDTVYFLPCQTEAEADFLMTVVCDDAYASLLRSMVFTTNKRPITVDILKRISISEGANALGLAEQYASFARESDEAAPTLLAGE